MISCEGWTGPTLLLSTPCNEPKRIQEPFVSPSVLQQSLPTSSNDFPVLSICSRSTMPPSLPFGDKTNTIYPPAKPLSTTILKHSYKKQLPCQVKRGSWSRKEQVVFLEAMLLYGDRDWVKVASVVPTRTTTQVRSHAQHVMNKLVKGCDVFLPLRQARHPRYYEALCAVGAAQGVEIRESNLRIKPSVSASYRDFRDMLSRFSPTDGEWEAAVSLASIAGDGA